MLWYKFQLRWLGDRRFERAAALLEIHPRHALGLYAALVGWAAEEAPDGYLGGYEGSEIARSAGWDGDPRDLIAAFEACAVGRWPALLTRDPNRGLYISDWRLGRSSVGSGVEAMNEKSEYVQDRRAQNQADEPVTGNVTGNVTKSLLSISSESKGKREGVRGRDQAVTGNVTGNRANREPAADPALSELWERALGELRGQMTSANYETWLADTQLLSQEGGRLVVGARSLAVETLEQRLAPMIRKTLTNIVGRQVDVRFVVQK